MPLIVEDSVKAYSEPLRNDSDADCSDVIGVDRLRRCAELASPFKSLASFRDNDQQRINPRGEEGQGDSDYGSSESSDQEGRLEHNAKKQLLHDAVSVARLRVDRCSTTEASEIEDSANEDDRVGSEVGKGSRFGSALFYHQHSEVLPAAPQQCRDASVETSCRPRQHRREEPHNIALRRKHLSSDTVRSKATRTSTHTDKDPGRQHHTSSASASTPCGLNDDHKTPPNLFEISGMSLHFKPNSDTAIAHVRALNPQSHAMAPIPGLETFGAEYQTVHWVQRTQESWLLVGFRNRTTEPISCTGRGRKSLGFEPELHISQDTTGLETSSAGNSSEEDDDHATGGVRGLSSREPWKESDNYRLLSYRDKEELP
ncbi:uncharacterized protein M421DRAFT_1550 [Didymella exigua CBS 183.55]|uniref:Uncharacterized protein n=1 Tax=Didymella exigua CBS 183.55 TaxID=1150837 RepID=A0A6A5S072_9PLEO|nr:uncharacterized protein M421DRAFT_1550 [Didymella exigua CBS 183.55]KAF1932980.1 hypothetical protein M421DRAFT_1550 [Didymella exigua CBS 183.55]